MRQRIGQAIKGHLVEAFEPEEVTHRGAEIPPQDVGLRPSDIPLIWASVEALYRTRLYPAIGLCIRHRGQVILHRTLGHARGNGPGDPPDAEKIPATPDTLFNLFSASKVFTAMLVHHLDDQGLLHLDDPVAEYIPEFAAHGKGRTTIRHVLTHRAGIPALPGGSADLDILTDPAEIVARICACRPVSLGGRRLAYHAVTGGFVLGEICRRVSGKDERTLLTEVVRAPMGLKDLNYGIAPERLGEVAVDAFTGPSPVEPFAGLMRRALGLPIEEVVKVSIDPRFLTGVVPSGNVIGTAEEACRFFEMLLRDGEYEGRQIFDRRTVHRATAEQTYLELDTTLILPVRYGMGFMLGADFLSFYGLRTPHAFGHLGFTNTLAYADPERDMSCCLMTSGKPFLHRHVFVWLNVMQTIARTLPRRRIKSGL